MLFNNYVCKGYGDSKGVEKASLVGETQGQMEEGVNVGGHLIKVLRFADDQAIISSSEEDLQVIMFTSTNCASTPETPRH